MNGCTVFFANSAALCGTLVTASLTSAGLTVAMALATGPIIGTVERRPAAPWMVSCQLRCGGAAEAGAPKFSNSELLITFGVASDGAPKFSNSSLLGTGIIERSPTRYHSIVPSCHAHWCGLHRPAERPAHLLLPQARRARLLQAQGFCQ